MLSKWENSHPEDKIILEQTRTSARESWAPPSLFLIIISEPTLLTGTTIGAPSLWFKVPTSSPSIKTEAPSIRSEQQSVRPKIWISLINILRGNVSDHHALLPYA